MVAAMGQLQLGKLQHALPKPHTLPKEEPFYWKCGNCGNVQSGSECKGCHTKYWHLQTWERVAKPEHTQRWHTPTQDPRTTPAGMNLPHQALSDVIHQLTNPKVGQDPVDPDLIQAAQKLQKDLLALCSVEEKHRRLQSVVSKLEHRQKQLTKSQEEEAKLQEKLQTLRAERTMLIKETEDLELERQELLKVVNPQDTETGNPPIRTRAWDTTPSPTQNRRHPKTGGSSVQRTSTAETPPSTHFRQQGAPHSNRTPHSGRRTSQRSVPSFSNYYNRRSSPRLPNATTPRTKTPTRQGTAFWTTNAAPSSPTAARSDSVHTTMAHAHRNPPCNCYPGQSGERTAPGRDGKRRPDRQVEAHCLKFIPPAGLQWRSTGRRFTRPYNHATTSSFQQRQPP